MARWIPPSKRKAQAAAIGKPLTYQYDDAPEALRVQVVHILQRAIGDRLFAYRMEGIMEQRTESFEWWETANQLLCEEIGRFRLVDRGGTDPHEQVLNFILTSDVDGFVDAVELCLLIADTTVREHGDYVRAE